MLPTKGYFQDIECPFNDTGCWRPYCHFRHKRKPNENIEDAVPDSSKNVVPTYKPTPKSELANIHNKSHIPISYVPDLAFKRERTARPIIRIEKPTYKPTPLSILSSANKLDPSLPENHEHKETIKDIQQNIASNTYDPLKSEINFDSLSNEFDLIDDIINDSNPEPSSSAINDNLTRLESDIEKEQNKLNLLQSELSTSDLDKSSEKQPKVIIKTEIISPEEDQNLKKSCTFENVIVKKEKIDDDYPDTIKVVKSETKTSSKKSDKVVKSSSKDKSKICSDKPKTKDVKTSSKDSKESSKEKEKSLSVTDKTSKSHKSSEREKHRKEEKKNSSKEGKESSKESSKDKHKSKYRSRDKSRSPKSSKKEKKSSKHRSESGSNSELVSKDKKKSKHRKDSSSDSDSSSADSSADRHHKKHKKEKSSSKSRKRKSSERSRSASKTKEKDKKSRNKSTSRSRSRSKSKSKENKSKHKSRRRSRSSSRSKSKHKEKDKTKSKSIEKDKEKYHKSREKDKEKNGTKSSIKEDSKSHSKKSNDEKKGQEKRKKSTSESNISLNENDHDICHSDVSMGVEDLIPSDIDLDLEDEDETMRECFRIFNEYKPTPIQNLPKVTEERKDLFEEDDNLYLGKKRTAHAGAEISSNYTKQPPPPQPKSVPLPGQILANRYKIAQRAQGSNEQENIMNEVKNITQQSIKRPATTLLEAARQHKIKKLQQQKQRELEKEKASASVIDSILNGIHKPSPSQVKVAPKRIAAVPNVALIEKARERISLIKQHRMQSVKTVAQTQKGGRVAHVPEFNLSDIPDVLQADKSKLPVNVRTRFLTMIIDECAKLYAVKQDAYTRALNEEFACYEKCKVLATYRNSAMLAVNRLRKELQDREVKGLGRLLSGETPMGEPESDFKGKRFYENVKKWILTEEELDIHGYPRESGVKGRAVINNRQETDYSLVDENFRKCCRCSRIYQVDDDGWALYEEECMYHPMKKRTIRGEQVFLCCKSSDDTGCVTSDTHVFDGLKDHFLEGYQTTLPPESEDDPRNIAVYALDCEMCYTTKGLELTRVTIVDIDSKTVYESFVKPLNPIIDYNTRFSGITKDQMDRTSTNILQIQANILHLCNSETILVGHSLESDLKALKIVHGTVIDTSVLFPHKMGLPHKRALRALASEHLKKIIQNDVSGHDSAEDAVTCMELIKWKLKEELKVRTKSHER